MAHGFKNFSKTHRCPICNGPDWCGIMPSKDGGELIVCQRDTMKQNTYGSDGNFYIFKKSTESGASVYEESNQLYAKELQKKGQYVANFDYSKLQHKELVPVDIIKPLDNDKLDAIYHSLLDELILENYHRTALKKDGWTDELIEKYHIRSFPVYDHERFENNVRSKNIFRKTLAGRLVEKYGTLEGVPGAFINKAGNWSFAGNPGILFPMYDANGKLYRLRIRLDKDTGYGKYHNFSSFKDDKEAAKQGYLKNYFSKGCQADNNLGYYISQSRDDMYLCYLTEGEKKGIIGEWYLKNPVISIPGVNSFSKLFLGTPEQRPVDILKSMGVRIFIVAFDADKTKNKAVLKCQLGLIEKLKQEGFCVAVADWDMSLGKGLDDLLVGGNRPSYTLI